MLLRNLTMLSLAFSTAACVRSTTFTCNNDSECAGAGAGAACELSVHACTFTDSACTSGRKYADNSGPYSGKCVGETGDDGGPGSEPTMGGEPQPMGCRADYVALGDPSPRGHKYLLVNTTAAWVTQRDFCATNMGFLAYPDGTTLADAQKEFDGIKMLAGDGAWIGIYTNGGGQLRNALNQQLSAITAMFVNLGGGNHNNKCLFYNNTSYDDDDCATVRKAVCECVP